MIIGVYKTKENLLSKITKGVKFIALIVLSIFLNSCANNKATELEQLLNQYASGDTQENEVIRNKDKLIIRTENSFQKTERMINLIEIKDVSYLFADEQNPVFPYQVVIKCDSKKSVEYKSYLILTDEQIPTSTHNIANLSFSDKKAALKAQEIILEMHETK